MSRIGQWADRIQVDSARSWRDRILQGGLPTWRFDLMGKAEIFGLSFDELPDDWQAIDAVMLVKAIKPDGTEFPYRIALRVTEGLTTWEMIGMIECLRQDAIAQYMTPPEENGNAEGQD